MARQDSKGSHWVEMPLKLDYQLAQNTTITPLQYSATDTGVGIVYPTNYRVRQRLINLLPQKVDDRVMLVQREKVDNVGGFFDKSATVANPAGIFWANTIQRLCELWGTTLYVWSNTDTYTTETSMSANTAGRGGFVEGINSTPAAYCFVATVAKSVVVLTGSNTAVSDAQYPASVVPTPVFLDGYIFIPEQGTRNIYNSEVGAPTSWTASGFTRTEELGGNVVALVRHHKHIVALCENHTEFFANGGIPAPNSPLIRDAQHTQKIGCINRATVATHGDVTYFAGRDPEGYVRMYKLDNYKITALGNASIDKLLQVGGGDAGNFGVITNWGFSATTNWNSPYAYMIPMWGKFYYLLTFNSGRALTSGGAITGTFPAFLYDPELNMWIEIASHHEGGGVTGIGGWPFLSGTQMTSNLSALFSVRFVMQNVYGGTADNDIGMLHPITDDGEVVAPLVGGFASGQQESPLTIQWPLMDFGSSNLKQLAGVSIHDEGHTNTSPFHNEGIAVQFHHYGQYVLGPGSGTATHTTYDLDHMKFAPANNERTWRIRNPLGVFYQRWHALQLPFSEITAISSIRFRLTEHEEQ